MSSKIVILMYILEVEYLIHVLIISLKSYPQFFSMYDDKRLNLGLICVGCALCVAMVGPGAKAMLFGHWFPPHVLSSTCFWYGTFVNGTAATM